jgi:phosphatidate cytidylyltransferase
MNTLLKRIIFATLAIPLFIFLIWDGGILFYILLLLLNFLMIKELISVSGLSITFIQKILIHTFTALQFFVFSPGPISNKPYYSVVVAIISLANIFYFTKSLFSGKQINASNVMLLAFSYITMPIIMMMWLRHSYFPILPEQAANIIFDGMGHFLIFAVFVALWLGDSAAYFVGRAIGKRKLSPKISPNKTWEGAIANFLFSIFGFWIVTFSFIENFPISISILCGASIGVFGQIGDLAESKLKRQVGAKDSSNIFPGHGGALDRFDSFLFALPIVYIILSFI